MILVDFNNVTWAGICAQSAASGETPTIDEYLVRHMVLVFLLSYKKRYTECGELVLCCDGGNSWRRDFFEHYKANRKRQEVVASEGEEAEPDPNAFDVEELWRVLNLLREEFKTRMPYKVIHLNRVEGDDGIAVLTKYLPGPHVIISNDKDFAQLLRFPNVKLYSPLRNAEVKPKVELTTGVKIDAALFLKNQIVYGDRIDGVPNILSEGNCFVDKIRQKSIMKAKLPGYLGAPLEENFRSSQD
jgi:5'-3' exonuclease